MSAEPRIPRHRWYQKQKHVKLPRAYVDKSVIRAEGIAIIDRDEPAPYPPCNSDFNAQDPALLPVGPDWVKVVAYERRFNPGGVPPLDYRPVVWVEVNSPNVPVLFRNATTLVGMQNGLNTFTLISAEQGQNADTFTATDDDGNGQAVTFCGYFPQGMAPGEVRPASFVPPAAEAKGRIA